MRRTFIVVLALIAAAGVLSACEIGPSYDFVVDVDADHADADPGDGVCAGAGGSGCSLRAAIGEANALTAGIVGPAPSIVVHLGLDVHTVSPPGADEDLNAVGDVDVIGSVTVKGEGHAILGPGPRAFDLHLGTLVLDGVDVSGTRGGDTGGGAVRTAVGTSLTVLRSSFSSNLAEMLGTCRWVQFPVRATTCVPEFPGPVGGGAILSRGSATIVGSTFAGNVARNPFFSPCAPVPSDPNVNVCGAAWGGAVLATGPLVVASSTFDGNQAMDLFLPPLGSAIFAPGDAHVMFSTTTLAGLSSSPAIVGATVRASIQVSTGCSAPVLEPGDNLALGAGCLPPSNLIGPLADNGGPTQTRMPAAGFVGVDAVPAERCLGATIDQRGESRPAGSACDIGAVERQPTDP